MNFWTGLIAGLVVWANAGLIVAMLLLGDKRRSATECVFEGDLGSGEFLRWASEEKEDGRKRTHN